MIRPRSPGLSTAGQELLTALEQFWDAGQYVRSLGHRTASQTPGYFGPRYFGRHYYPPSCFSPAVADGSGATVVRFLASAVTEYVQVHVQHDGAGGGGEEYDTSTFVSSERIDCRADRQQEVRVGKNGTDRFYVWLVPVLQEGDGTFTKFDGVDGADHMAVVDIGT